MNSEGFKDENKKRLEVKQKLRCEQVLQRS